MPPSRHHPARLGGRMFLRLGVVAAALALAACKPPPVVERGQHPVLAQADISKSEPGQYGGVFVLGVLDQPKTFNYLGVSDQPSQVAVGRFLSGLVGTNPLTQNDEPALATSWEIGTDKKTYTFHLRQGVQWSDGVPFTADDVIFTFDCMFAEEKDPKTGQAVIDPDTGKPKLRFTNRLAILFTYGGEPMKYRKIDDYTVEFYTPAIYSPFISTIGTPILPKHKLEAAFKDGSLLRQWSTQTAIDHPEELVATGPFRLRSFRPGERLVWEPNPYYWRADKKGQRLPYLDFLVEKIVGTPSTEMMLFSTGQLDAPEEGIVAGTDEPWVKRSADKYHFIIKERGPIPGSIFTWFNLNPGKSKEGKPFVEPYKLAWFSNKLFRQAIMYGFNREGIVKGVYFGRAELQDSFFSRGDKKWFDPNVRKYPYDPAKARELLTEAGFHWDEQGRLIDAQGHPVAFDFMATEGAQKVTDIVTTFAGDMKALGIDVHISYMDFGLILQKMNNSFDYEMTLMGWGSSAGLTDPAMHKTLLASAGEDHFWHVKEAKPETPWEARIDTLMDAQEQTFDEPERIRMFHEIQEILAEEVPLFPLVTPHGFVGIKDKWRNVEIPPAGDILWNIDELWTPAPQ